MKRKRKKTKASGEHDVGFDTERSAQKEAEALSTPEKTYSPYFCLDCDCYHVRRIN